MDTFECLNCLNIIKFILNFLRELLMIWECLFQMFIVLYTKQLIHVYCGQVLQYKSDFLIYTYKSLLNLDKLML